MVFRASSTVVSRILPHMLHISVHVFHLHIMWVTFYSCIIVSYYPAMCFSPPFNITWSVTSPAGRSSLWLEQGLRRCHSALDFTVGPDTGLYTLTVTVTNRVSASHASVNLTVHAVGELTQADYSETFLERPLPRETTYLDRPHIFGRTCISM